MKPRYEGLKEIGVDVNEIWRKMLCFRVSIGLLSLILIVSWNETLDKWGFGYLIGWFVGGTGCTLQTLYAWLMRGFGIGIIGILIYRVLHLSLGCDSWYACYVINLVK